MRAEEIYKSRLVRYTVLAELKAVAERRLDCAPRPYRVEIPCPMHPITSRHFPTSGGLLLEPSSKRSVDGVEDDANAP